MSAANPTERLPGWIGKLLKSTSNRFILGIVVVLLTMRACNPNVDWEEEVLLNTGETIVVKRSGSYSYGYSAGSGFIGFSPNPKSTIKFEYKGKRYSFTGFGGLRLVAIAPDGLPNLVASAGGEWARQNKYSCDPPYYVQFRPSADGREWTWPDRIDPWLYKLPTNLVLGLADLSQDGKRFSPADRQAENGSAYAYPHARYIDPTYFFDGCIRSK